ncbi:MAG: hypothetical protein HY000_05260 [Planctomycetes bacterium]|nr:hypothetical protein [Planctomycetota bacterium]
MKFSSDGQLLATRCAVGLSLWQTATARRIEFVEDGVVCALSPDGKWVATMDDAGVRLREAVMPQKQGLLLHTKVGSLNRSAGFAAEFSPDSQLLATGFEDGTVRLWDRATGKAHGPLLSNRQCAESIHFRPGWNHLALVSSEGTVRLWETETGQRLGPPWRHPAQFLKVVFSPDGKLLATLGEDLRLWALPEASLSLEEMHLRTWVALGVRLDAQGVWEAIPGPEWQGLRQQLQALPAARLP